MLKELNKMMDYLEDHLNDDISEKDIMQICGMSEYQFKRVFTFLAKMPLNEYLRNRKLALANQELIAGAKVTAVAFKYGYQSVEGFSRAFKAYSGYLPSEVRKNKYFKNFDKFSFYLNIKGGNIMEVKIEKKDKFNIVGISKEITLQYEGANHEIVDLAKTITLRQKEQMHKLKDLYPNQVLNVSYNIEADRQDGKTKLMHMIGLATTKNKQSDDLEQLEIEENTWAIFPNKGPFPKTLQDTWSKIFSEWLPSSISRNT